MHAFLTASPLDSAVLHRDEVWTSGPCIDGSGSLQTSLDGASPAKGTVLPPGRHTFAVTFANCLVDGLVGIRLNGVAAAAYTSTDPNDLAALVSVNSMRGTGSLGLHSDIYDVTADGSGTWTRARRDTGRSTTTYSPAVGSRLLNNLTTNVATFGGGSYAVTDHEPTPGSASLVQREYNNLAVAINGTDYILSGSLLSTYGFDSSRNHSGEVRITSNSALVARVYGDGGAFRVEVLVPLVPL